MKFGSFMVHWSLAALKNFEENLSTYFGSITVFMKEASKITVIFSAVFYPDSHVFMFFKIVQVYLHLAICRVYKGHLKNKWLIKTFQKHPKVANLSALSPAFSSCKMYTLFVEIQRYLEIPRIDFCETSHSRRQAPKVSVVKSISKESADTGLNLI